MRKVFGSMVLVVVAALLLSSAQAGEKAGKEVTLKGTITCAKCDLGKETKCMTVIVAKNKDNKEVTYYLDPTSSKKYHAKICTEASPGTVTGTVSKDGDKQIITATKVSFDKK